MAPYTTPDGKTLANLSTIRPVNSGSIKDILKYHLKNFKPLITRYDYADKGLFLLLCFIKMSATSQNVHLNLSD